MGVGMSLRDDLVLFVADYEDKRGVEYADPVECHLDGMIEWLRENKPRITAEMRLWTDGIGSLCDLLGGEV